MWSIERVKLFGAVLAGISIPACASGVALALVHAGPGWYYGVCIFLSTLGTFRVMFPGIGIPERYTELPASRSRNRTSDISSPSAR